MSESLVFIIETCCVLCEVVYEAEEIVISRAPRMIVCKRRLSTMKRERERECV
jgi:hypothetical protein